MDSLHLKASELFTLQTEAAHKVREDRTMEIAKNGILAGFNNEVIHKMTQLTFEQIEKLRNELKQ